MSCVSLRISEQPRVTSADIAFVPRPSPSHLVMALPAHYNDPGIIERSVPLNEVRARARARVRSLGPDSG